MMEMVVGLGFLEMLLLAGSAGLPANDVASVIPADDYFASRKITVNVKEMMTLAGKEADGPKAQFQQLLAIRWLGENATTKTAGTRELVEQIAEGKKAQDRLGFAKA